MNAESNPVLNRRHFFSRCSMGLGGIALASLLDEELGAQTSAGSFAIPRLPNRPPRAKNVIYLFMAGGPSQLELFDYKPRLQALNGQAIPDSFLEGKRFAFMDTSFK